MAGRQKGHPKTGGRKAGTLNKHSSSRELKEMILSALDKAGGEEYLVSLAVNEPRSFVSLLGRVLPMQVTGENGQAIKITWIQ